jgi:hypothetical protein
MALINTQLKLGVLGTTENGTISTVFGVHLVFEDVYAPYPTCCIVYSGLCLAEGERKFLLL